jgi:hypothetical protein
MPGVAVVTELLGPRGATLSNTTPGHYTIRGTYTLPPGAGSGITIELTFAGSVTIQSGSESVEQVPFVIPTGSLQGNFEARGGFLSRTSGTGRPGIIVAAGSSALDCVELF